MTTKDLETVYIAAAKAEWDAVLTRISDPKAWGEGLAEALDPNLHAIRELAKRLGLLRGWVLEAEEIERQKTTTRK